MLRNIALAATLIASGIAAAHADSPFPMSPNESGPYQAQPYIAPGAVTAAVGLASATFPMSVSESGPNTPDVYAKTAGPRSAALDASSNPLGAPAEGSVARTLRISSSSRYVNVSHMEAVRLIDRNGRSFTWAFGTPTETHFPLHAIAPAGFDTANATVYVTHPAAHVASD